MRKANNILAYLMLVLASMQLLLILASWIVTSVWRGAPLRSLISSEGIRWFFGEFVSNMASPLLVWLLLLSIAYGIYCKSGLKLGTHLFIHKKRLQFRQLFALWTTLIVAFLYILIIVLLSCTPHAVLLSSTGKLFPSSFSNSLVPIIAFGIVLFSIVYGLLSNTFKTIHDIFKALSVGMVSTMSLWIIYILGAQLYHSLIFVMRI